MEHQRWCLQGVSSSLSKQLDGRENSAICLKRKQRRSIAFSLQLCFHTAVEAGCLALLNDTLVPPTPRRPRVSPWLPSPVTAMIRERWDEYVRRDLILLNATSPVNSCQFCHCRFQTVSRLCVGGWGAAPEGLIFPTAALYWIIPHSLVQLSRGGVKQLTCDMSPQPPSPRKESYCPSAVKVFIFPLLPWAIWAAACIQCCLNTSCFFDWSPLVPVEDTNLVLWHCPSGKRDSTSSPLETIQWRTGNGIFYSLCLLMCYLDWAPIVLRSWNGDLVLTLLASPYGVFMYFDTWRNVW